MTEKHAAARGEIARRFEEKRQKAESAAEARRAALKAKDPAFSAICDEKESYLEKILLAFTRDAESAREELSSLRASHAELREREAEYLKKQGIESHVTRVEGGWERVFESRQEAYDWFIQLADYPELLDKARFHQNIDSLLSEQGGGYLFHLPTISEVTWFKTR